MLSHISICNIVLIEKLEINFSSGFSVLTGETGSGKSTLLDALSLALGGRGDPTLVRHGCEFGQIVCIFELTSNHPVHNFLKDNGYYVEDSLILKRVQFKDGRSRAYINDQLTSISYLKALGKLLVEFHGQHADRAFMDLSTHRDALDLFSGTALLHLKVKEAYESCIKFKKQLSKQHEILKRVSDEKSYLCAAIEELEELSIQEGEETALAEKRMFMMKFEKILSQLQELKSYLNGPTSPISSIVSFMRKLERRSLEPSNILDPILESLSEVLDKLSLVDDQVDVSINSFEFNPDILNTVEERLFSLRAIARKHSTSVDGCIELLKSMKAKLEKLNDQENNILELENKSRQAEEAYFLHAQALSTARIKGAKKLKEKVMQELPELKLERAKFEVLIEVDDKAITKTGFDRIEFLVQTNPGSNLGSIMKIASGGEQSRFLLALKVCLANCSFVPTLIFDEIDTGVSGSVSDAIGQKMSCLGQDLQVISITHAPQVAVHAQHHFLISKKIILSTLGHSKTYSNIELLSKEQRFEEIGRLLSGDRITEEARAAARRLLQN